MLEIRQIDLDHTPEFFNLYNEETGEYDLNNLNISNEFTEGISIRKRVSNGIADKHVYKNSSTLFFKADNEDNWIKVAKYKVYPETYNITLGTWDIHLFPHATLNINEEGNKVIASCVDNIENPSIQFNAEIEWSYGKIKEQFITQMSGELIRTKCFIEVFNSERLVINYDDYPDTVRTNIDRDTAIEFYSDYLTDADNLESLVILTFSPSGFQDQQDVDPYIAVDEQSTYIDVTCDGYTPRFYIGDQNSLSFCFIFKNSSVGLNRIIQFDSQVYVGSTAYQGARTNLNAELIEQTPTRVHIKVTGNYQDSSDTDLTNSTGFVYNFYIYDDRISFDYTWTLSDSVTLSNSFGNNIIFGCTGYISQLTNESNIHESSGSEVDPGTYVTSTGNYFGFTADEINVCCMTYIADDSVYQRCQGDGVSMWSWNNQTLTSGDHTIQGMIVFDSAEREGGKQYDHSDDDLVIDDDFSTDTSSDYTALDTGGGAIYDAVNEWLEGEAWDDNILYHSSSLGSADQWVKGTIERGTSTSDSSGILLRVDPTGGTDGVGSGYSVRISSNTFYIYSWEIDDADGEADYTVVGTGYTISEGISAGTDYNIIAKIVGSTIQVYLDNELILTATDSTYSSGNYAGVGIRRVGGNSDIMVDNFQAGTFSADKRLILGTQYHDISTSTDPTVNNGSEVTDLNIPDTIGSTILASDGAYHIELEEV